MYRCCQTQCIGCMANRCSIMIWHAVVLGKIDHKSYGIFFFKKSFLLYICKENSCLYGQLLESLQDFWGWVSILVGWTTISTNQNVSTLQFHFKFGSTKILKLRDHCNFTEVQANLCHLNKFDFHSKFCVWLPDKVNIVSYCSIGQTDIDQSFNYIRNKKNAHIKRQK